MSNKDLGWDCPGDGKCHGCMAWCDRCGDVSAMCEEERGHCDAHHCVSCRFLLTEDEQDSNYMRGYSWVKHCDTCYEAVLAEERNAEIEREQAIATMTTANPSPLSNAARAREK